MTNTVEEVLKERIPTTDETSKEDFDCNEFLLDLAECFVDI